MKDFFKNLPDESTPFEADRFNELLNGEEAMESIVVDDISSSNLFDGLMELGSMEVTDASETTNANFVRCVNFIKVKPNSNYIFNINGNTFTTTIRYFFYDKNYNYLSNKTGDSFITTPENCYYIRFHSSAFKTEYGTNLPNPQIKEGDVNTSYTPYKKFGYNSQESMGKIIVDDISSNNKFDINSLEKGHIVSTTGEIATAEASQISSLIVSDNSVTFTTTDVWKGISSGFMEVKPLTPYYFLYETTSTAEIYFYVSCYDKNKNHLGRATKNGNEFITLENTKYVRWCTQLVATGTITLTNLQFKDENSSNYKPHVDFKNEIQYLTNFITAKSGYTIKSQNIFRQNNHYWGNVVIQKDSGTFGSTQEDVATLGASIKGNVNSGCFMSAGQWSAKNVGYLYMGDNYIKIADPNATTNNIVKIDINVVV